MVGLTPGQSHQNKFHGTTLRNLTIKFASMPETEMLNHQDRELWSYFAALYKNSNKGIKGRGKDRRISTTSKASSFSSASSTSTAKSSPISPSFPSLGMDEAIVDEYTAGSSSDEEENYYVGRGFQQRFFPSFRPVF